MRRYGALLVAVERVDDFGLRRVLPKRVARARRCLGALNAYLKREGAIHRLEAPVEIWNPDPGGFLHAVARLAPWIVQK